MAAAPETVAARRRARAARPRAARAALRRSRDDRAGWRRRHLRVSRRLRVLRAARLPHPAVLPAWLPARAPAAGRGRGAGARVGVARQLQRQEVRRAGARDALPVQPAGAALRGRARTSTWCIRRGASGAAWGHRLARGPRPTAAGSSMLERTLFGVRRIGDVPGHEIPGAILRLHAIRRRLAARARARAQSPRPHLAGRADGPGRSTAGGRPCFVGQRSRKPRRRPPARARRSTRIAETCYRDAAERGAVERGPDVGVDARRRVTRAGRAVPPRRPARSGRRVRGRRSPTIGGAPAGIRREALEALAIHFEHRARDLEQARRFAQLSLAERVGTQMMQDGRHRLARLDRKLSGERGWTRELRVDEDCRLRIAGDGLRAALRRRDLAGLLRLRALGGRGAPCGLRPSARRTSW